MLREKAIQNFDVYTASAFVFAGAPAYNVLPACLDLRMGKIGKKRLVGRRGITEEYRPESRCLRRLLPVFLPIRICISFFTPD